MKLIQICKRSFLMAIALTAAFAFTAAWPGSATAANPKECGMIGTWYGSVGASLKWLDVHTAGSKDAKNGEMLVNWVRLEDYLLYACYDWDPSCGFATSMTPGHGVWEQIRKGEYKYTWYAYGIQLLDSAPVFSVRVSGTATTTDCDNLFIDYTYEVFAGFVLPQDMSGATPVGAITDVAESTRVPLTVVTP